MRHIFTCCLLLLSGLSWSQTNPGNIGTTNLTAWFRADDLIPGSSVSSWTTTYPTSGAFSLTPASPGGPFPYVNITPAANVFNYNAVVDFTGSSDAYNMGLFYSPSGTLNLLDNSLSTSQGTMFIVYQIPDPLVAISAAGQHMLQYRESSTSGDGIQLRRLATLDRIAIGNSGNVNATKDYIDTYQPTILSYKGNYLSTMGGYQSNTTIPPSAVASASSGYKGLYLGTRRNQNTGAYEGSFPGYISEVIFYNTNLTVAQFAKVHSYLAIKYGITLTNEPTSLGGNGNYASSDGTTIWDATVNPVYHHNVIAIGADGAEGLIQKQSHTSDDSLRIYVGTLAVSNAANISLITNDKSYVVIGDNNTPTCNFSYSTEYPAGAGIFSRIDREWKIQNTGFANNFSVDIRLNSCANVSHITPSDLVLLVDYDDGDFSNASIFNTGSGINFALNGNVLTINNISNAIILQNSKAYITIASLNAGTPLPVQFIKLSAQQTDKQSVRLDFNVNYNTDFVNYNVQKSIDAKNWMTITNIKASKAELHYATIDNKATEGKNYYRIQGVDVRNDIYYSSVQSIAIKASANDYFVYPNPATDFINIDIVEDGVLYTMYDIQGRKIMNGILQKGKNMLDVSGMTKGLYSIKIGESYSKISVQ